MSTFDAVELIRTKRDGGRLDDDAIDWLIRNYTDGAVSDEQMSAMAMVTSAGHSGIARALR